MNLQFNTTRVATAWRVVCVGYTSTLQPDISTLCHHQFLWLVLEPDPLSPYSFLPSFSNPCSLDMCPMTYHLFPTLLYLVFGFSCPSDIAPIQVQLWDYLACRSIFVLAFCLVDSLPTVQSLLTYKKTIYSRPGRPYLEALSMSKFISSCVNTSHWGKTLYVLTDQCQVTIVSHSQTTNFEMLVSNKVFWHFVIGGR